MSRRRIAALGLGTATVVGVATLSPAAAVAPVSAHLQRAFAGADSGTFPSSQVPVGDVDNRGPRLPALASATAAVAALGKGVTASYNQYGTPLTITAAGKPIVSGLTGTPEQMARGFLSVRPGLLGMTADDIAGLELLPNGTHSDAAIHTLMFRQRFSGLPLAEDGLVAVTERDGNVYAVTSSAVPPALLGGAISTTATRTPVDAVLAAAHDVGVSTLTADDLTLSDTVDLAGLFHLKTTALHQDQLTRLRVLPTTNKGARLVWETVVEDVAGGLALAVTSYVDDATGAVLLRRDDVDTLTAGTATTAATRSVNLNIGSMLDVGSITVPSVARAASGAGGPIMGSYPATQCSEPIPLDVDDGTVSIAVTAVSTGDPSADITIQTSVNGSVTTADTGSSPEAGTVTLPHPSTAADVIFSKVCPFDANGAANTFVFAYAYTDVAAAVPTLPDLTIGDPTLLGPGTYRAFASNPALGKPASDADRYTLCNILPGATAAATTTKDLSDCVFTGVESPNGYDTLLGIPTMTTSGNNAVTTNTQESSSLTPGPPALPAVGAGRDYAPSFTDSWQSSGCDPAAIVNPAQNMADIDASVVNLFVGHNRIHDFAYRLGLTEKAGALQFDNLGNGGTPGDPELGDAQNGATLNPLFPTANGATTATAELALLAGRNNANQITEMDGVAGITNQYLFEPVVGFYGPCADGGLDSGIFLHEYTHAISNRLIAGPDTGLSGQQGGSMGESWSDLDALEFLYAFGVSSQSGADPFALGAFATGDLFRGIRDFNLKPENSPLTYAQFGFDTTGAEVHADGEVWNVANTEVRQALMQKYDALGASSTDFTLQRECALGVDDDGNQVFPDGFTGCPGNRHWITYMYDSLIMQANGAPSMVDMKNLEIAAAAAHFPAGQPNDVPEVTAAFAKRGLGVDSSSVDSDDITPVPGYNTGTAQDANVTFSLVDDVTGAPVAGRVVVGTFEARARALATTLGGDMPDASAPMVGGVAHQFVVQAAGYGLQRFTETFTPGSTVTQVFKLKKNLASGTSGATITGDDATALRMANVIDDSETTDGGFDGSAKSVPVAGRNLTVALAGGSQTIGSVAISALHHPVDAADTTDFQGRLLGVHDFQISASNAGGDYVVVYDSTKDVTGEFFPTGPPRATAPDLNLRTVTLPQSVLADHLKLTILSNTCTGTPAFTDPDRKSDAATLLNGSSVCTEDNPLNPLGASNQNASRVTVTELEAFGTTATPQIIPPAAPPAAAPTVGGSLASTGLGWEIPAVAVMALAGAGALVRRSRRV